MNKLKLISLAVLLASGAFTLQATAAETSREQRMEQARQDYQKKQMRSGSSQRMSSQAPADSGAGPVARAEAKVKRGAKRTGAAIQRGASKTGAAVSRAGTKTKNAIRRTGERMGGSDKPNPNNPAEQK